MVRIVFTWVLSEAGRIKSLLESEGFNPGPIDSSAHWSVAGADQGYYVEIPNDEAEAARVFLEQQGMGKWLVK